MSFYYYDHFLRIPLETTWRKLTGKHEVTIYKANGGLFLDLGDSKEKKFPHTKGIMSLSTINTKPRQDVT